MQRLVLADDSLTIQKVVELSFADEDFAVHAFADGISALEYLREQPVDIVLVDVSLPFVNGYDLCQEVSRNPRTAQVPVILLSGTFEVFDSERARQAGCREHLKKPFETTHLVEVVKKLLSERAPAAQAGRAGGSEAGAGGLLFDIPLSAVGAEVTFPLTHEQVRPRPAPLLRDMPEVLPKAAQQSALQPEPAEHPSPKAGEVQPARAGEALPADPLSPAEKEFSEAEVELVIRKVIERLPGEIRRLIPEVAADLDRSR